MKKISASALLAILFLSLVSMPVGAVDSSISMSEGKINLLRATCLTIQSSLDRVHSNDTLARTRLGYSYEAISSKLMAPMNSRIALNKLDGINASLVSIKFNSQLDNFRLAYQDYSEELNKAIHMNCHKYPVEFYAKIESSRAKREKVREITDELFQLISQYREEIVKIQASNTSADKDSGAQ